jgi:hypothetical protein
VSSTFARSTLLAPLLWVAAVPGCSSQESLFSQGLLRPPSVVQFQNSLGRFNTVQLGQKASLTWRLSISGGYLPEVQTISLPSPFAFVGGSFPGSGGTCNPSRLLDGCTIKVEFEPTSKGVFNSTFSFSYTGGEQELETLELAIRGATPAEVVMRSSSQVTLADPIVNNPTEVVRVTIEHLSGDTAQGLTITNSSSVVGFEGGQFPGSTGTCSSNLVSGTCTIALVVNPTERGALSVDSLLSLHDGAAPQVFVTSIVGTVRQPARLGASPQTHSLGRVYLGGHYDFPVTLTFLEGERDAYGIALLGLAGEVEFAGGAYPGTGGNCPAAISNGSCTLMLRATPAALGIANRELSIAYRSGPIWAYLPIQLNWETVTPGVLSWSDSTPLNFGTVAVGDSATQELTLSHSGGEGDAQSLAITLPSHFSRVGGSCLSTLPAGQSCTLEVRYSPVSAQTVSGGITVQYNNGATTASITRSFSATTEASIAATPGSGHDFGNRAVGAISSQAITFTHVGGAAATGVSASISGGSGAFSISGSTCSATLSAGTCAVTVRHQSSVLGAVSGSLNLQFHNGISLQTVSIPLTALGVATAQLTASSSTLDFGSTVSGGSFNQTLTLTYASGGVPAQSITATGLAAPFTLLTNGCTSGLASDGATCSLVFRVSPTSSGTFTRAVTVQYNNGASTQSIALSLTTQSQQAAVLVVDGATPVNFGSAATGTSVGLAITVRHASGGVGATALAATPPAQFRFSGGAYPGSGGSCTITLDVAQSCTLMIEFAPAARGTFTGNLGVSYHDGATSRTVNKSLTARSQTLLTASPAATVAFGARATGSTHTSVVTITHGGGVAATSLVPEVSSTDFSVVSTTCGASLSSGTCTITVGFTPRAMQSYSGTLTLAFNNGFAADTLSLALTGSGSTPATLAVTGSTSPAGTPVNGSNTDMTFTVRNTGGAAATSLASSSPSAIFRYKGSTYPGTGGNCSTTLNAGAQCTIVLQYSPSSTGSHSANLVIQYFNGNSSTNVTTALSGSSVPPAVLTLAGSSLDFSVTAVGQTSVTDLTLQKAAGLGPASNLRMTGLSSPFGFHQGSYPGTGGTCPATLSAAGTCTLRFAFSPGSAMRTSSAGTLTYFDGVQDRTLTFTLSGYTPAQFGLTASVQLGDRAVGAAHQTTFVLTRTGGPASVALVASTSGTGFGFSGTQFPGSGGTCSASFSGTSCTMVVALSPSSTGPWSGTLDITAESGSGNVSLTRTVSLEAKSPALVTSPDAAVGFADTNVGASVQEIVIIENTGSLPATGISGSIVGSNFSFVGNAYPGTGGTCGGSLAVGASCTVLLRFSPTAAQAYSASLQLSHHDGAQLQAFSLPLEGTGLGAAPAGKTISRTRSIADQDGDGASDWLMEGGADRVVVISSASDSVLFEVAAPASLLGPVEFAVWQVADLDGDRVPETLWQWISADQERVVYELRAGMTGELGLDLQLDASVGSDPRRFTATGDGAWTGLRFEGGREWGPWGTAEWRTQEDSNL